MKGEKQQSMWIVTERHVQIAGVANAVAVMVAKWLTGVLVGKLISSTLPVDDETIGSTPFLDVILLNNLSFQNTAILSIISITINTVAASAMSSLAVLRSAETGRLLRGKVLKSGIGAIGGSASASADMGSKANELTVKIKLVEDFQANEEHWLLFNWVRIVLCIAFTLLFTWYGALLGTFMIVSSEVVGNLVEKKRANVHAFIEKNAEQVSNRLLDVIKNSVMIKITHMGGKEAADLNKLASESDSYRMIDAWYRFCRDTGKILLTALVPPFIVLLAWPLVLDMSPREALATGTSILVTMLLLDEGHKSLIYLGFVYDRQLAAKEALEVIDEYVGTAVKPRAAVKKVADGECSSIGATYPDEKGSDEEIGCAVENTPFITYRPIATADTMVALDKIVLRYHGRDLPALNGYSAIFERVKIHALVGESGSGKSSTLKVIANLVAPQRGSLHLWRGCKIAYVSQEQKLFGRTVRENVTYGSCADNMQSTISDRDIWIALAKARIDSWVCSLPGKLDEVLLQGENMVSGGQLQRLHLAHLFCTGKDAGLVLLDECMSALDEESREFLIDQLAKFLKGKTAIIVTHHSEVLRICDYVHNMRHDEFKRGNKLRSLAL